MKRRDSVNKKLLCIGAICSLISLFIACEALSPEPEPEPEPVTVSYEKAVVRVQIGNGVPGRTVMPDIAQLGIDKWKLLGGKGANTDLLLTFDVVADAVVALEPGEWHFTIEGYKGNDHILSGSIAEQTIRLEGTQTLSFEVAPVESVGSGTVSITIKLPAESGITSMRVHKDWADYTTRPVSGNEIVFEEDFPAEEYHFSFRLYNEGDELLGVVSEMVHVWANLTSAKTYTLLQKDLNLTYTISYLAYNETTQAWEEFMPDGHYQIAATTKLAAPSPREGYYFKGWYERADLSGNAVTQIPVGSTGNKDFYSKWIPKTLSGYSLEDALGLISANPETGEEYTITLNADESFAPTTLSYGGAAVSITLKGDTTEQIVSLSEPGSLFTLGDGVTLKLGDNITLEGRSDNTASLVSVNSGAALEMNDGSKIRGNSSTTSGGGVSVGSGGAFTMNGGEISGNTVSGSTNGGGGVYINGGTFTLSGGAISGNSTPQSGPGSRYGGGGVYVTGGGTFEMTGGEVSGNSSKQDAGGVFVYGATFRMSGGAVSGNTATSGGGVYISDGTFNMAGGEVSGNIASSNSGGVYAFSGTFNMAGGTVSGNSASNAGGVYVGSNGTFTKASGGVIYGSDAEPALRNTASSGTGHAVHVVSGSKKRDSTVAEGETLNSAQNGAAGGWVDRWNVTFDADGGAPSAQTARLNSGASLGASMPSNPARDGCAFGGWYTAQNGAGDQFTAATAVTRPVTVYAFWLASASVQIDLRPVPDDPALSATTLLVSEEAAFSAEAGYASYQWYWDGIAISGATSPSYTLAANAELPGVYELSVVVAAAADPDEQLSARCQVTITAG